MDEKLPTLRQGQAVLISDFYGEWEFAIEKATPYYHEDSDIPFRVELTGSAHLVDANSEAEQVRRFEKGARREAG